MKIRLGLKIKRDTKEERKFFPSSSLLFRILLSKLKLDSYQFPIEK